MYPKHVKEFLRCYDIQYPIIQAPMAGGITTVELVASVCNAGGIGSFGAAYMSVEQLDHDIKAVKKRTSALFSANLFCFDVPPAPAWEATNPAISQYMKLFEQFGIETPSKYPMIEDLFSKQLEVLIEHQVPIISFTFGVPDRKQIERIQSYGGKVWITVTNLVEAQQAQDAGVDALIVQAMKPEVTEALLIHKQNLQSR